MRKDMEKGIICDLISCCRALENIYDIFLYVC